MPKISTLSGISKFKYSPDGLGGFYIEYKSRMRPHIKKELIQLIENTFKDKKIPGGFNVTDPIPGGFGEWLQKNSAFTPRTGCHIAAVLKEMGIIKDSTGKKSIMLQF